MIDHPNYLDRQAARVAALKLKYQIVFGLGLSAILLLSGGCKYYLVADARHEFWRWMIWIGFLTLFVTLAFPSAWTLPERGFRWLTGRIGHGVFLCILAIIYGLLIVPVGWWLRRRQGCAPIWEWTDAPPQGEGWHPKTVATITSHAASKRRRLSLLQSLDVIGYFVEHRMFLLLPLIIILVALGLVFFFVQTSAIAPFIYTIF